MVMSDTLKVHWPLKQVDIRCPALGTKGKNVRKTKCCVIVLRLFISQSYS